MASRTEICNLALSHLGSGKDIANLDTEKSEEARACRRFFETARDATLRDFAWPFAQRRAVLGLIETFTSGEWTYSYRYPSTCLKLHRLLSGIRNDNRQSRAPYEIASDDIGRIIYTDMENAEVEYTNIVPDASVYTIDFVIAFSFRLSSLIAPRLTKGDPFGLRKSTLEMYYLEISRAKSSALNENQNEELPKSEFERARD